MTDIMPGSPPPKVDILNSIASRRTDSGPPFIPVLGQRIAQRLGQLSDLLPAGDMRAACNKSQSLVLANPYSLPPEGETQIRALIKNLIPLSENNNDIARLLSDMRADCQKYLT